MKRMVKYDEYIRLKKEVGELVTEGYIKEFTTVIVNPEDWSNDAYTYENELVKVDESVVAYVSAAANSEDYPNNIKNVASAGISLDAVTENGFLNFHAEKTPTTALLFDIEFDIKVGE